MLMNRVLRAQQLCCSTLIFVVCSLTIALLYGENKNIQIGVEASSFIVETTAIRAFVEGEMIGKFDASLGDFGYPLYGRTLVGQVLYNSHDSSRACSDITDPYTSNDRTNGILNTTTVPVAIVKRGGCYFAEKAFYAQEAGAKAVLIMDDKDERLITMSKPQNSNSLKPIVDSVEIPVVLITQENGKDILSRLENGDDVILEFDFRDAIENPDDRVEWEIWGTSSSRCGSACKSLSTLRRSFASTAAYLERLNYTEFTPYYLFDRSCYGTNPLSCNNYCIRGGRYCISGSQLALDPSRSFDVDQDLPRYNGRDVAFENLRQLCMFEQFKAARQSWLWWSYTAKFDQLCTMDSGDYTRISDSTCGDKVLNSTLKLVHGFGSRYNPLEFDMHEFRECSGMRPYSHAYSDIDEVHPLLEKQLQEEMDVHSTGRGQVNLMPTIVVNTNQYRGRLKNTNILSAICAGFTEMNEPSACLSERFQVDECKQKTDTCWRKTIPWGHSTRVVSACQDTFRDYECKCPRGWAGDGHLCHDINECNDGEAKCDHKCVNTPGSYKCECKNGFKLIGHGTCLFENFCLKSPNGGCEERCIPVPGRAKCTCSPGLIIGDDEKSCDDIDECKTGEATCEQLCINTDPREDDLGRKYFCACEENYILNMTDPHFRHCIPLLSVPDARLVSSSQSKNQKSTQTTIIVTGTLLMLFLATTIAVMLYKRKLRRDDMSQEVRSIMKDYIALNDDDKNYGHEVLLSPGTYSAPKMIPQPKSPVSAGHTAAPEGKLFTKKVTPTSIMDLDALNDDDESDDNESM